MQLGKALNAEIERKVHLRSFDKEMVERNRQLHHLRSKLEEEEMEEYYEELLNKHRLRMKYVMYELLYCRERYVSQLHKYLELRKTQLLNVHCQLISTQWWRVCNWAHIYHISSELEKTEEFCILEKLSDRYEKAINLARRANR